MRGGRRELKSDEADVVDAVDRLDFAELFLGGAFIDGDEHEGAAPAAPPADLHGADVDIELAEQGADAADHAGAVFVVAGEEEGAAFGDEVHVQAIDDDDMGLAVLDGAGDGDLGVGGLDLDMDEVVEDFVRGLHTLIELPPAGLGNEVGVHHVHVLFANGAKEAADDGGAQRRDVVLGDFAVVVDFDAGELARDELRGDGADGFGDGHVGLNDLEGLGGEHRGVDGVAGGTPLEDIDDLITHYLNYFVTQEGLPRREFTTGAKNRLRDYRWPGNVRELKNLVQRLLILGTSEMIEPYEISSALDIRGASNGEALQPGFDLPLREAREKFEKAYLEYQLHACEGSVSKVADRVGIERTHLYRKLRNLGIDPKHIKESIKD